MRFHVVSLPHTNTTDDFASCAFTEKVRKFCIMMHQMLGHEVFLYAGEYNDAPCNEHICCITEEERKRAVGDKHYTQASFDYNLPHWLAFNQRCIMEIKKRAQKEDFLCVIAGLAHAQIANAMPHITCVEFGIGYGGTFAKFRVFESYAWMHTVYGAQQHNRNPNDINGNFFDAVVPGYFEVERFPFSAVKDDYYLYVGRVIERKGHTIAQDVCSRLGVPLVIAGQCNNPSETIRYGEYKGVITPEQRGPLMARAKALFVPTCYIEPFGNVAVEAQGCGTPVISTDWGAMTETVIHGVTGFRCRTLQEFMYAAKHGVKTLDPYAIRKHAVDNYSLETIARKYETYFKRLLTLWGAGWDHLDKEILNGIEEKPTDEKGQTELFPTEGTCTGEETLPHAEAERALG